MTGTGRFTWPVLLLLATFGPRGEGADGPAADKPRFREFMGLCGHTIQFKPVLYAPVCRAVRDYHPFEWDVGNDTSFSTRFPSARNGVDWGQVYGEPGRPPATKPKSASCSTTYLRRPGRIFPRDAALYGRAFAKAFGPSSKLNLVAAVEIGNEPGHYDDESYRSLFEHMAGGLRQGDPKLKVGTCALTLGESGKYAKSVKCVQGPRKALRFPQHLIPMPRSRADPHLAAGQLSRTRRSTISAASTGFRSLGEISMRQARRSV